VKAAHSKELDLKVSFYLLSYSAWTGVKLILKLWRCYGVCLLEERICLFPHLPFSCLTFFCLPQYVWDRMLGGFKHKNFRTREGICLCLIATLNA